jgi:hypothetical protein
VSITPAIVKGQDSLCFAGYHLAASSASGPPHRPVWFKAERDQGRTGIKANGDQGKTTIKAKL